MFILTGCTIESFIVAGDVPPPESTVYRNEDGEFVDITPADVSLKAVIQYYGHIITLYMQSSELGGLPAGDYRAEYGPYYVDFKMSEQPYVVD